MDPDAPFHVVVGVDPSEVAQHAALWAAQEAHDRHGRLTVAHALELSEKATRLHELSRQTASRREQGLALVARVAAAVSARHPGLPVETEVSDLAPARSLSILSLDAGLLVTGTRGLGASTGMLLGSVSRRLAAQAYCPLVVVGHEQLTEPSRDLVLAVGNDESLETIDFAFETAARIGLRVRAVRAFQPLSPPPGHRPGKVGEDAESAVLHVKSLIKVARTVYPHVPVAVEAHQGVTVPALCGAARGARLLVVGSRRDCGGLRTSPGHTVQGLLSQAETPVAVVPTH